MGCIHNGDAGSNGHFVIKVDLAGGNNMSALFNCDIVADPKVPGFLVRTVNNLKARAISNHAMPPDVNLLRVTEQ